jgi:chemotaxis protein methyltransferase WspC
MSLLNAGLVTHSFHLDAVDISEHALERARLAVYGKNSFRGKDLKFQEQYFTQTPHGSVLDEMVRDSVKFKQANFLDPKFVKANGSYNFIFCRNLLIYFSKEAQARTFEHLKQLLAPNGLLFLGPAELPLAVSHGFISTNVPLAFACRKAEPVHTAPSSFPLGFSIKKTAPVMALPDLAAKDRFSTPPTLETARELADAGRWTEAAEFCTAYLRFNEASVAAFHLLGRAHEANGALAEAEACYRKALYLDPNHRETLLKMVALARKKGDEAQVRIFQRRIKRVEAKMPKA